MVDPTDESVLRAAVQLPDGSWIRGRALRHRLPPGPAPDYGLYLGGGYRPDWLHDHIQWPDFWLPRRPRQAAHLLQHAHHRARTGGKVEIACWGGRGRTGTALAAIAILAGAERDQALAWVREHYDPHAVETPWQRRWLINFPDLLEPD